MPSGVLLRTTSTSYLTSNSNYRDRNILGLPTSNSVSDSNGVVAQDSISYDESAYPLLNYGAVTGWNDPQTTYRGNPTTVSRWLNCPNSLWIQTHTQYDQLGNVRKSWDGMGRTDPSMTFDYSSSYYYAYPTTTSTIAPDPNGTFGQPTGLITTTVFDFNTGLVTSATDANSRTTTFEYNDPLYRQTKVTRADGGWTSTNYNDDPSNTYIRTQTLQRTTPSQQVTETYQYLDKLGRSVRSFINEGSTYLTRDTQYDLLGRVSQVSNPYRTNQPSLGIGINPSNLWTVNTFDPNYRDRIIAVTTADGAHVNTQYGYSLTSGYLGLTVTGSDQMGRSRKNITDAFGRVIQVVEDPSALGYQTNYTYDVLNNLRKVEQGSQVRYFGYDSLSRLIRVRHVEQTINALLPAWTDPVTGYGIGWTSAFTYDNNGNMLTRTDARNIITTFTYDQLNRVTTARYTNDPQSTPGVDSYYDGYRSGVYTNIDNIKGRVWQTETLGQAKVTIDNVDVMGRIASQHQQFWSSGTWSGSYQVSAAYDLAGSMTGETYPSGHSVTYDIDPVGRLKTFSGNLGDNNPRTYASNFQYNDFGALQQEQFGTQIPLYHKQRFNVRGQLWDIRLSTVSFDSDPANGDRGSIVNYYSGSYSQGGSGTDNNGNLLRQESYIPSGPYFQQTYAYDNLNRLSSVNEKLNGTGVDSFKQVYGYDRWGNRTVDANQSSANVPRPSYTVDQNTNRLIAPAGYNFGYDYDGNQTNDTYTGGGQRVFDAEDHMISAQEISGWQYYKYSGTGLRVRRIVNGVEVWQIYDIGGALVAEYAAGAAAGSPQKEYGYRNGQLLVTADAPSGYNGYLNRRTITIDHTKVPNTDQINFPVLIKGTYSYLATVSNGGNVQNANGYDVIFTSDAGCTTKLNHEVESYNASTGAVNYWVKVPSVSHTADTVIYLCYGNSAVTTDQSNKTAVWDTNYKGVWHLNDNAATTTVTDSTGANNGTNQANTSSRSTTGQAGKALSYNGSSDYTDLGINVGNYVLSDSFTLEAWINPIIDSANHAIYGNAYALAGYLLRVNTANKARFVVCTNGSNWSGRDSSLLSSGWHHVVAVWNGSGTAHVYIDGTLDDAATVGGGSVTTITTSAHTRIGAAPESGYESYFNGTIDEVRSSKTARSADWIKTEYNNQSSLATFYSVSGASAGVSTLHWMVTDQLGTPRIVSAESGAVANISRHDYLPFGEEIGGPQVGLIGGRATTQGYVAEGVRKKFTGYESDGETSLNFAQARYDSAVQGRFTSVDPLGASANVVNPQSFNRYSYVANNPLTLVDPSGAIYYGAEHSYSDVAEGFWGQSFNFNQPHFGGPAILFAAGYLQDFSINGKLQKRREESAQKKEKRPEKGPIVASAPPPHTQDIRKHGVVTMKMYADPDVYAPDEPTQEEDWDPSCGNCPGFLPAMQQRMEPVGQVVEVAAVVATAEIAAPIILIEAAGAGTATLAIDAAPLDTAVIGSEANTAVYVGQPGFNVLRTSQWSWEAANVPWLNSVIRSGQSVLVLGGSVYTHQEAHYLISVGGYVWNNGMDKLIPH